MNPDLAQLFETELRYFREGTAQFARREPKIAARMGLSREAEAEVHDPFVERLREGVAMMAARARYRMEVEYPQLFEGLLGTICPQVLNPIPSAGIVCFQPDDDTPPGGHVIDRGARLRSHPAAAGARKGSNTVCTFSTAHPVRLLPLRMAKIEYITRSIESLGLDENLGRVRSCLRLVLEPTGRTQLTEVAYDELCFFLAPGCPERGRLLELLLGGVLGLETRVGEQAQRQRGQVVQPLGFGPDLSLLPPVPNRFEGYRHLREYFSIPDRYLFVKLTGLKHPGVPKDGRSLEILIPFDCEVPRLETLKEGDLQLYCTPVINLFTKNDIPSIVLEDRFSEYRVRADEDREDDFEVFELTEVVAKDRELQDAGLVPPLFGARQNAGRGRGPFYSLHRTARLPGSAAAKVGIGYTGSELNLRLVDGSRAPFAPLEGGLRLLMLTGRCTNRDLPLSLALGVLPSDFQSPGAFVQAARFVVLPRPPVEAVTGGPLVWQLISHLSLNYLSLVGDGGAEGGAQPLREMLRLYFPSAGGGHGATPSPQLTALLEAVREVRQRPTTRFLPGLSFGLETPVMVRGVEIEVTVDESAFAGTGAFLFGMVLNHFFQGYVALNSFVETVLCSTTRQEIHRWAPQIGNRPRL